VFVCEMMGDQTVDAYSSMGRVMALYVARIVSFCLPQLVEVSALSMFSVVLAFVHVWLMCSVYVSCVSKVRPRILLWFCVLIVVLSIWSVSFFLCSAGSGVKSVAVVLLALRCRLLLDVHCARSVR